MIPPPTPQTSLLTVPLMFLRPKVEGLKTPTAPTVLLALPHTIPLTIPPTAPPTIPLTIPPTVPPTVPLTKSFGFRRPCL